jgi:hypothetical protein
VIGRAGRALVACAALAAASSCRGAGEACLDEPGPVRVCAAPDGAKLPNHGPVPLLSPWIDPRGPGVRLAAARDEVAAFQVVLRATSAAALDLDLSLTELVAPAGSVLPSSAVRLFLAHHVRVDPGGYTWGPPTRVLEWPDYYPDALVPFVAPCGSDASLVTSVRVPGPDGPNRMVWVDVHVPRDQPPGAYRGALRVAYGARRVELPLEVEVAPATLPAAPSLDAVAELYRAYANEGVGTDLADPAWRAMAQCYQQLAHAHRAVFVERVREAPRSWDDYDLAHGPALDGTLFTPRHGYDGPGQGAPVTVWRTPWPQRYDGRLERPLPEAEIASYEQLAEAWDRHAAEKGWDRVRFFAYVFDEIDGPQDASSGRPEQAASDYLAMAHGEIARVQQALDRGARTHPVDLLWTSHSDPARWAGTPGHDLAGIVRLWCPNARAASPEFLQQRIARGERAWFYHAGHPSIGAHSINVPGHEMRTWGVVAARYRLNGMLAWAADYADPERPYERPTYKAKDDRFGNGTLVYPGALLPTIGLPAAPGPIPSVRLKMLRRGIQDADLAHLAREAGRVEAVDRLLRETVPRALAEGRGKPSWPADLGAWDAFHRRLLELAGP